MTATNTWCAPSNVTATLFGPIVSSGGAAGVERDRVASLLDKEGFVIDTFRELTFATR
jgi:hypothetical protein